MARVGLGWHQQDLADKAAVARPTVARIEAEAGSLEPHAATIRSLQRVLENEGVKFTEEKKGTNVRVGVSIVLPAKK